MTNGAGGGTTGRHTAGEFDAMYAGTPPWDIGRPQPAFVALLGAGALRGRVLDVGCGTGEHVLMAAAHGFDATGIDVAATAIDRAMSKAHERALVARFILWDALALGSLREQFDTILDCGLFHTFDDDRRARFVESLGSVAPPGTRYFMLCFSDREPGDWGPRRVTQDEIRDSFATGWQVDSIEPATIDITIDPNGARAWLVTITRR